MNSFQLTKNRFFHYLSIRQNKGERKGTPLTIIFHVVTAIKQKSTTVHIQYE